MSSAGQACVRASNAISVDEMSRLLRQNVSSLGEQYQETDYAMVVAAYESFLLAALAKTPRLNKKVLEQESVGTSSFEKLRWCVSLRSDLLCQADSWCFGQLQGEEEHYHWE